MVECIVEVDQEKFLQVVLEVLGDGEGCVAIDRRKAVNFVHIRYLQQCTVQIRLLMRLKETLPRIHIRGSHVQKSN